MERMDTLKEFYEKYKIYLTRHNLELLAVTVIVLSAMVAFTSGIPSQGALTLDKGAIKYNGSLVRGKMNGQGTLTLKMGIFIKVILRTVSLMGREPLQLKLVGSMKATL